LDSSTLSILPEASLPSPASSACRGQSATAVAQIGQPVEGRDGFDRQSLAREMAIHQKPSPPIRQRIVEQPEQRAKGQIPMLMQSGLGRQLERR
jgi:hypothetical protein